MPNADRLARILVILWLSGFVAPAGAAPLMLTDNDVDDKWGNNHPVLYDGQLLWVSDGKEVIHFDGGSIQTVQSFDPDVPELGAVMDFVFGMGSGALPGQVTGAWRRGADYAWVWTSGSDPVLIDTFGANLFEPGEPTNPEALAIADGCVFMVLQAGVDGNVYKHAFEIDPLTGEAMGISGNAPANGADVIATDDCKAVWVFDPNVGIVDTPLPTELQYWDGSTTRLLDRGAIALDTVDLDDGRVVYVKQVDGVEQVFALDLGGAPPEPQRLSDSLPPKVNVQIDGRHVAWGELAPDGTVEIVLLGGLSLTRSASDRTPTVGRYPFSMDSRQIVWRDQEDGLRYMRDNVVTLADVSPTGRLRQPWVSGPYLAWYGDLTLDDWEVFRLEGDAAVPPAGPPPPLYVEVLQGVGRAVLRWDEVLGADRYTVYYANDEGLAPDNYDTLPGGGRIERAESPLRIEGLTSQQDYVFIVTASDGMLEGPPSAAVISDAYVVETVVDEHDADVGDGDCAGAVSGACTLRAAVQEASYQDRGMSVAVPAGHYALTSTVMVSADGATRDLDVEGRLVIVGAGAGQTIIDANGFERVFEVDPGREGIHAELIDLTVTGGDDQGIYNRGRLELSRVTVTANGQGSSVARGGGVNGNGSLLVVRDSQFVVNGTSSHGGGVMTDGVDGYADIRNTLFDGNFAGLGGGAIYNQYATMRVAGCEFRNNTTSTGQFWPGGAILNENRRLDVRDSAFHDNQAGSCGGAIWSLGELYVINTTLSHNTAVDEGGALCSLGASDLSNVTVAENVAPQGPGLWVSNGTVQLANSVLTDACGVSGGSLQSLGFNVTADATCGFAAGDQTNTDPMLAPLEDNGGPTPTHALLLGSPAIDAGDEAGCRTTYGEGIVVDQRGGARPYDGDGDGTPRCDAGAFELGGPCLDDDGDGYPAEPNPLCDESLPLDCDDAAPSVYPGAPQVCDGVNNDCFHGAWPSTAGTDEYDDDGDGLSVCDGDCRDDDAAVWATPGPVVGVRFTGSVTMEWQVPPDAGAVPAGLDYDVLRSQSYDLGAGASCLPDGGSTLEITAGAVPDPGQVLYYVVRAGNACPAGAGTWGTWADGTERLATACD